MAPVSCPVVKNVENIKHVKCKKVTKTTGVKTLFKTPKPRDMFHCQTKNRFELLALPPETSDNCVNMVMDNAPGRSESRDHAKAHSTVNSGHIKPNIGLAPKPRQKTLKKIIVKILPRIVISKMPIIFRLFLDTNKIPHL